MRASPPTRYIFPHHSRAPPPARARSIARSRAPIARARHRAAGRPEHIRAADSDARVIIARARARSIAITCTHV